MDLQVGNRVRTAEGEFGVIVFINNERTHAMVRLEGRKPVDRLQPMLLEALTLAEPERNGGDNR
jgi:hypothetical protein